MSAAASWSYTKKATHWPRLSRADWGGVETFGPPVVFLCDYSAKAERMVDQAGVEFVTRELIFTEKANIALGDRVLIGASAANDPIAAGALEVRAVQRFADTFDGLADDYKVAT